MAAHLEGKGCTALDFTGLAQKNGAVMSHLRIAPKPDDLSVTRIPVGGADLLIGCDMVVAAGAQGLSRLENGVSRAVINTALVPTASFVTDGNVDFEEQRILNALRAAVGPKGLDLVDGTRIATALMGDSIATNLFMLGFAFQKGLVPVGLAALERAIEINGAAVEANKQTFAWGRLAAHDLAQVEAALGPKVVPLEAPKTLESRISYRVDYLTRYQDAAYAARYSNLVSRVREAEMRCAPGSTDLWEAAALSLFKLMAIKDEYEVARLYTDGSFLSDLRQQFEGNYRLEFHLAPPMLAERDPATGHLKKRAFGPWVFRAFKLLAGMRGLRGGAFDIFGRTAERRMERQLLADYEKLLERLMADLRPDNRAVAVELARLPQTIKGFGHVKERNVQAARDLQADLIAKFDDPSLLKVAAE
jgi:indolepyruvate ferredoxin oxidoreductase